MGKRQLWLVVVIAFVAGFLGAAAAILLFADGPVLAQSPAAGEVAPLVKAQEFQLVDSAGRVRAGLRTLAEGGTIWHLAFVVNGGISLHPLTHVGTIKRPGIDRSRLQGTFSC